MMDELKMKLSSKFMKGIVTKLIAKAIEKKLGYKIDILLNEIDVTAKDGKVHLHIDADVETTNDEFKKMLKSAGLD